ncbi:MAG TPA: CopD family protein [Steroidobacteraceae bacterium]|nr:CopD family protein [Steroidobacteraceae bacterium]
MAVDFISVTLRALGFTALFQAVGLAFFLALFGRELTQPWPGLHRIGRIAAIAGLLLVLLHPALEAPRMAGDFSGLWDSQLQRLAWSSGSGMSALVQAAGLLGLAVSLPSHAGGGVRWATLWGLIAIGGFLLTGHTSTHALRPVLAAFLALHLFVVAFWFGSLVPLLLVIREEARPLAAQILARYSAIAGWLVPLILVVGLGMAWILAGSLAVLRQPYGQLLIAKIVGFALLMLLAAANRWRLVPALAAGSPVSALRRSILMEIALLVAVLSTTAVLTTYYSPH